MFAEKQWGVAQYVREGSHEVDELVARTAALMSTTYARAVDEAQELGGAPDKSVGQHLRQKWLEVGSCLVHFVFPDADAVRLLPLLCSHGHAGMPKLSQTGEERRKNDSCRTEFFLSTSWPTYVT